MEALLGPLAITLGVQAGERLRRRRRGHERLVDALVHLAPARSRDSDQISDELTRGTQRQADHGALRLVRADHQLVREPRGLRAELLAVELSCAITAAAPDDGGLELVLRERRLHQIEAERVTHAAREQLEDRQRLARGCEGADGTQQAEPGRRSLILPRRQRFSAASIARAAPSTIASPSASSIAIRDSIPTMPCTRAAKGAAASDSMPRTTSM